LKLRLIIAHLPFGVVAHKRYSDSERWKSALVTPNKRGAANRRKLSGLSELGVIISIGVDGCWFLRAPVADLIR
jgi:hypothetical protein